MLVAYRASFLKKVRAFFDERQYIEVDVPLLSPYADIDTFIDPLEVQGRGYLHTSPEYAMKEILARDRQDIYFLGHVFRSEEKGKLHNEEFTMIEWYKTNTTEALFFDEVLSLLRMFLGDLPVELIEYDTALSTFQKPIDRDTSDWTEEEIRHYIWGFFVEPHLGDNKITIVENFRKEDAALAKVETINGREVAKRFEFFYKGIELANGFFELSDPKEQKKRFIETNHKRTALGKKNFSINPHLISALERGLPPNTFGMAAGFDRLLMLHKKELNIQNILPLPHIDS